MGGCCAKEARSSGEPEEVGLTRVDRFRRPRWHSEIPIDRKEVEAQRAQFWDTEPHYGGERVIWDALKLATESDDITCQAILEGAGVVVAAPDLSVVYDERGHRYDLPSYLWSNPTNITNS